MNGSVFKESDIHWGAGLGQTQNPTGHKGRWMDGSSLSLLSLNYLSLDE